MPYANREMTSGHPAGSSTCPQCKASLYYAAELKLHDRTEKNVVYCSGGCGWLHKVVDAVKDAGIAAAEVAGEIVAGASVQDE